MSESEISRRDFLVGTIAAGSCSALKGAISSAPVHLPRRLTICYWGWDWISSALPDEPWGNVEQALVQTKERGFNCVRAEVGLNWMYDLRGKRRGKLKFTNWIPGYSSNLQCVDGKGGAVFDIYNRVMELLELAAKHDMYVITTSWEYQDSISCLDDDRIREEIVDVPCNSRLMLLAHQYDRFLAEVKSRGLQKQIAFAELINEMNSPPIVCSLPGTPNHETFSNWVEAKTPQPRCDSGRVEDLAYAAVAFLRQNHPDLLISVDIGTSSQLEKLAPENVQIADHHVYADGITQAFWREVGIAGIQPGVRPDLASNPVLRSMLKPKIRSWDEMVKRATHVRRTWWPLAWLYTNLDNEKFDAWCEAHYAECKSRIVASIQAAMKSAQVYAQKHNLPLVVDEGFILYPPLHSKFVTTRAGRWGEEQGVNAAIETGHWGIMISGYFRPNTPPWHDDQQCDWARDLNNRILRS